MGYKTILVPLDGSDFSKRAVDEAVKIACSEEASILLLSVVELPTAQFEGYAEFVGGADLSERIHEQLGQMLARTAEELKERGIGVETELREGFPHEEIVNVCKEHAVDVIVMTTHGRRGFIHWLMGSVAEKVVRSAPCSVLVVRAPTGEASD